VKIAILMEYSGHVRDAFIARGHDAISVDFHPTERPGPHYEGDVFEFLRLYGRDLDAFIAHPTCTFLCNSGCKHLYRDGKKDNGIDPKRWADMEDAAETFRRLDQWHEVPLRAIENPIMHCWARELVGRRQTQIIQPWQFGHQEMKATGLWLTGFPPLRPTWVVGPPPTEPELRKEWAVVHRASPGPDRWRLRSRTYPGIADAMADQWGSGLALKLFLLRRRIAKLGDLIGHNGGPPLDS
jgi:hypothetical protein